MRNDPRPDRAAGFPAPGAAIPRGEAPSLRVLVVEDEPLIRWSVAQSLIAAGHTVLEADDAASSREIVRADGGIDVCLLDLRLPDSHDLELMSYVRRVAPRSAVVLMTAFGNDDVRSLALDMGAYAVLDKPFDMHAVEHVVRRAAESRSD
jgi:two-component system, NtrC family, response regulator AtoC